MRSTEVVTWEQRQGTEEAGDSGIRPRLLGSFAVRWARSVAPLGLGAAVDPGAAVPAPRVPGDRPVRQPTDRGESS